MLVDGGDYGIWNQSQVWSADSSFGSPTEIYDPLSNAFDGDFSSQPNAVGNGEWQWNPSDGLAYTQTVEVYPSISGDFPKWRRHVTQRNRH